MFDAARTLPGGSEIRRRFSGGYRVLVGKAAEDGSFPDWVLGEVDIEVEIERRLWGSV